MPGGAESVDKLDLTTGTERRARELRSVSAAGDAHSRARLPSVSAPPVDQQEARVSTSQSQCFHPMEPNSSRLITTISLLSLPAPGLMKLIITQTEHQGRARKKGGKTTTAAITSVITFYR